MYYEIKYRDGEEQVTLENELKKLPSNAENVGSLEVSTSNNNVSATTKGLTVTIKGERAGTASVEAFYGGKSTTIEVNVNDMFNLTLSSSDFNMGSVSPDGTSTLEKDSIVSLTATPTSGSYRFVGWYEGSNLLSANNPFSYRITNNANIEGRFERNTQGYTLTIRSSNSVMGSVTNPQNAVRMEEGEPITVTANANNGYKFSGWYLNGSLKSVNATYSGVMPASNTTLEARFEPINYTISYVDDGGTVDVGMKTTSYNINTNTFTLPTMKKAGYSFTGWTGSNGSTPQRTVSINKGSTGDKSFVANYSEVSLTLSQTNMTMRVRRQQTLVATVNPSTLEITWSSSNMSVATVSSSGVVTPISVGVQQQ